MGELRCGCRLIGSVRYFAVVPFQHDQSYHFSTGILATRYKDIHYSNTPSVFPCCHVDVMHFNADLSACDIFVVASHLLHRQIARHDLGQIFGHLAFM
jgi:hypothetical protein